MQGSFLGGKSERWGRHKDYIRVAHPQKCLTLLKNLQKAFDKHILKFQKMQQEEDSL